MNPNFLKNAVNNGDIEIKTNNNLQFIKKEDD